MVSKKQAIPTTRKRLSKFRFPAKNDRPAETIEAESLEKATEIYNNPL